ncbi:DUF4199 domain-containing protein [candidate division KSB1 bacterium]|nr:DUF4199 domain-containing protein [candidate division KSB1 bacterium]
MRKVTLTYGLLAGAIVSVLMLLGMVLWENGTINFDNSALIGYAIMVIALSMIFFGIKSYRDNYQNGVIKFVKGLQVGALITLIASLMYATAWETCYQTIPEIKTSFMDKYTEHTLNKMKAKGASPVEISQKAKEMAGMVEMYKNPVIRFGFTLLEILPVGIAITLICAAVLRRKGRQISAGHVTVSPEGATR